MNTKFKLTDECINLGDRKLYRIEALKDTSWSLESLYDEKDMYHKN